MIPNSKAMNMVPAPTPRRVSGERSAVQANNVGLETPVANPKIIAAIMYELTFSAVAISIMLAINRRQPAKSICLLPIRSDIELVNRRIKIVEMTYTPKKNPLFSIPKNAEMSGVTTKMIPEQVAVKNMTTAAGRTVGSKTSFHLIFNRENLNLAVSSKDSRTSKNSKMDKMEQIAADMKSTLKSYVKQIHEPIDCPAPIPSEINVPQIPIALPLLSLGTISVIKAVAPVGVNPALNPCKKRRKRKKNTVEESG